MDEGKADMGMAERERIEKDTDEIEDVTNVFEFLIPAGTMPADCSQFSLSYNKTVLDGWVRQPSACCGAASVAGAWNALAKLHRSDKMALTHESVLTVYRDMFVDMIQRKQASFERKLGSMMQPLLDLLKVELAKEGKEIGGKRAVTATKKSVSRILRRLAKQRHREHQQQSAQGGASGGVKPEEERDVLDCIVELLLLDGVDLDFQEVVDSSAALGESVESKDSKDSKDYRDSKDSKGGDVEQRIIEGGSVLVGESKDCKEIQGSLPPPATATATATATPTTTSRSTAAAKQAINRNDDDDDEEYRVSLLGDIDQDDEDDEDEKDAEEEQHTGSEPTASSASASASASVGAKRGGGGGKSQQQQWDWLADLMAILKNIGGLKKIRAARPSTALIGTWGILQVRTKEKKRERERESGGGEE